MTFATVSVSASGLLGSFSCGAVEGYFASRYGSGDMKFLAQLYTEDSKIMPPGSDVVTGRTGQLLFTHDIYTMLL